LPKDLWAVLMVPAMTRRLAGKGAAAAAAEGKKKAVVMVEGAALG
jgi:hypothetical protein